MEPRIQYAKTTDGVSIAYSSEGQGMPLVIMPAVPLSTILWWPSFGGEIWQPFKETFRIVFYDSRGGGYSDRNASDFSMGALIRDLDSVVEAEGLDEFILVAFVDSVPVAVSYAVQNPDRVKHLILCDGYVSAADFHESAAYKMQSRLIGADWKLYREAFAQVMWGPEDTAYAQLLVEWMRESCSEEVWWKSQEALETRDISSVLAEVRCPTLVIHNRNNRFNLLEGGQRLAAGIAGARLALIDDLTYATVPEMVAEFVGGPAAINARRQTGLPSGTAIIVFADIVDSTALTERLGDAAFREKARELAASLRALIRECGGTSVEGPTLGDGVLAVFPSAREAIAAAQRCAKAGNDGGLPLHLGLHAGDVTREKDPDGRANVYGGAVNIASRISGLSAPGEVLVSETVRSLARTSAGVEFEDRGEQALKGVGEAVRVWAVVEGGE